MLSIATILCPVDFSEGSARALDYATSMALRFDATLHLLHVRRIDVLVSPDGGLAIPAEALREIAKAAHDKLASIAEGPKARGAKVEIHDREGSPAEEAVALAGSIPADLIVVGTHGRTGLSRLLLGSVAERIVRTSPVPVLTVRTAE